MYKKDHRLTLYIEERESHTEGPKKCLSALHHHNRVVCLVLTLFKDASSVAKHTTKIFKAHFNINPLV
jgi:hypothetical protein